MRVAVLHVRKFGSNPNAQLAACYGFNHSTHAGVRLWEHVANVTVPEDEAKTTEAALDYVFNATNHLHRAWQTNPGIEAFTNSARSTSVNDVMVTDAGEIWQVAGVGWKGPIPANKNLLTRAVENLFRPRLG